jgi:hypothetical protein
VRSTYHKDIFMYFVLGIFLYLSFSLLVTQSKLITLTVTTILFYSTCILVLFFHLNWESLPLPVL